MFVESFSSLSLESGRGLGRVVCSVILVASLLLLSVIKLVAEPFFDKAAAGLLLSATGRDFLSTEGLSLAVIEAAAAAVEAETLAESPTELFGRDGDLSCSVGVA